MFEYWITGVWTVINVVGTVAVIVLIALFFRKILLLLQQQTEVTPGSKSPANKR